MHSCTALRGVNGYEHSTHCGIPESPRRIYWIRRGASRCQYPRSNARGGSIQPGGSCLPGLGSEPHSCRRIPQGAECHQRDFGIYLLMKRRDLTRYLEDHDCEFLREGANHTVYVNRRTRKSSTVPRHREINNFLVQKICNDLDIPKP